MRRTGIIPGLVAPVPVQDDAPSDQRLYLKGDWKQLEAHADHRNNLRVWTGETLLKPYIQIYGMVKTIRVSEEYHKWLRAHKREDETMEETLRRMTRGPYPDDVAGLLTTEEADHAKEAVEELRDRDRSRFDAAREAFEVEDSDE